MARKSNQFKGFLKKVFRTCGRRWWETVRSRDRCDHLIWRLYSENFNAFDRPCWHTLTESYWKRDTSSLRTLLICNVTHRTDQASGYDICGKEDYTNSVNYKEGGICPTRCTCSLPIGLYYLLDNISRGEGSRRGRKIGRGSWIGMDWFLHGWLIHWQDWVEIHNSWSLFSEVLLQQRRIITFSADFRGQFLIFSDTY